MQIFVTGTDTDIGKTIVSGWLCLHLGYSYFKPIQSGADYGRDSILVQSLSNCKIYPEIYSLKDFSSPHLAAKLEGISINLDEIQLPADHNLIVEGAGGVFVPINYDSTISDVIKHLNLPVLLVSRQRLGTINHTLLTLEHLSKNDIRILGVIMVGERMQHNIDAIERFGKIEVLAELPNIAHITKEALQQIPLPKKLLEKINEYY